MGNYPRIFGRLESWTHGMSCFKGREITSFWSRLVIAGKTEQWRDCDSAEGRRYGPEPPIYCSAIIVVDERSFAEHGEHST